MIKAAVPSTEQSMPHLSAGSEARALSIEERYQTLSLVPVSVIMPVRNEERFIGRSLGAVLNQDYPHELLEVLIADGQSIDETRTIIDRLASAHSDVRLVVVENENHIAPSGFNKALAIATGAVIVRVDGHCEIAGDYVRRCVEHLQRDGADGVGGPIETIGTTRLSSVIALAMSSRFGVGGSAFRTGCDRAIWTDTIAFPAYTRRAIELAGPLNEELVRNQDDEYNYRLRRLGCKLLLAPDVRSRYYSRSSLRSLSRQFFQYGYWKVRVMQLHPAQMRLRHFVPPAFAVMVILNLVLAPITVLGKLGLVVTISCYTASNLLASALVGRQGGWRLQLPLILAFAIMHFSYGLGFLAGLGKFWNRWLDRRRVRMSQPQPDPSDGRTIR